MFPVKSSEVHRSMCSGMGQRLVFCDIAGVGFFEIMFQKSWLSLSSPLRQKLSVML